MNSNSKTQRDRILQLLLAARGEWVPLPKIMEHAVQYNARLHELRHLGFRIPPSRIKVVNGKRHSWYPIALDDSQTPIVPVDSKAIDGSVDWPDSNAPVTMHSELLFSDVPLERHRDDG